MEVKVPVIVKDPEVSEYKEIYPTWTDTYSGIPHPPTDERVMQRAELFTTLDDKEELYFDLEFPG